MKPEFYRYKIEGEIISREPLGLDSLQDVADAMTASETSIGTWEVDDMEWLDSKTAARLLLDQRLDPAFFGLDKDGNEAERR